MELAEQVRKFAEDIEHYEYSDDLSFHLFKDKFRSFYPFRRDYVKYVKAYYRLFVLENVHKRVVEKSEKVYAIIDNKKEHTVSIKKEMIGLFIKDTKNYIHCSKNTIEFHGENIFDKEYLDMCIIESDVDNLPRDNKEVSFNLVMEMDDVEVLQELIIEEGIPDLSKYNPMTGTVERVNLLNLAQLHGAVKCFKWLFLNGYYDIKSKNEESIVYGGNYEILHIMERETTLDYNKLIEKSIIFHKHDLFEYFINHAKEENIKSHFILSLWHYNYYATYRMIEIFDEIKIFNISTLRDDLKNSYIYQYIKDFINFEDEKFIIIKKH